MLMISECGLAYAEWLKVATTIDNNSAFYVDSDSIRINGNLRTAWELVNESNPTNQGYKSIKANQEYNCKSNQLRMLYASTHSEMNGKGKTIKVTEGLPSPWQTLPEGSVAAYTRDYICNKKPTAK